MLLVLACVGAAPEATHRKSAAGDPSTSVDTTDTAATDSAAGADTARDTTVAEDTARGTARDTEQACDDVDGDRVTTCDGDCDDGDAETFPGAVDVCDGVDNDCPVTDNYKFDGPGAG